MKRILSFLLVLILIFGIVGCSKSSLKIEGVSKEFIKDVTPYFNTLEKAYNESNPSIIDEKFSENLEKIYNKYKDSEFLKEQHIVNCIGMMELAVISNKSDISKFKEEYKSEREFLFLVIETNDIYEQK